MSIRVDSQPNVSDSDFPGWWATRLARDPAGHSIDLMTGDCLACSMTHEEVLDYPGIECRDAVAARLPPIDRIAQVGDTGFGIQRHVLLNGLWVLARRRKQAVEFSRAQWRHKQTDRNSVAVWAE